MIRRLLPGVVSVVALLVSGGAQAHAAGQPGFIFPSRSIVHPGDRIVVRWQGSSAHATAHLSLYGPYRTVAALKQHPYMHRVKQSAAVHGVAARRQVVLTVTVPRGAQVGYYDLRASSTVHRGTLVSTAAGDMVLSVAPRVKRPTAGPGSHA
jgi:hypothetical protein